MKLGIVGLPGAGKATVFSALTGLAADPARREENLVGTIPVPDNRVDVLSTMYRPKKTTYAQVEYFLPGLQDQNIWNRVRDCDALIHVVRNFTLYGMEKPNPFQDFISFDQELVLSDLVVVEKRLERLELDAKRGKKPNPEELLLLESCKSRLEEESPLRHHPEVGQAPLLRGFAFVSAKPMLVLFNNMDEDEMFPEMKGVLEKENCLVIRGKLEQELSQMSSREMEDFLKEFNISASARNRVIQKSYELLGLISFFTVGDDEVRAWTIRRGTEAVDAAGAVHSDMKKGFIRAEVLAYKDLLDATTYAEARKRGTVRLEGKTYPVADGDIMNFRFNV
jgi:hypothetical protein